MRGETLTQMMHGVQVVRAAEAGVPPPQVVPTPVPASMPASLGPIQTSSAAAASAAPAPPPASPLDAILELQQACLTLALMHLTHGVYTLYCFFSIQLG